MMRLINGETLKLEEFVDNNIPTYAILSHTWGSDEVTFQDITTKEPSLLRKTNPGGWGKITHCCELAAATGIKYSWVDTCSIDKTSSAELSEAINSMFRWYSEAKVCFVYLSDIEDDESFSQLSHDEQVEMLSDARWFTRGWTLQELIAPNNIQFYSAGWKWIFSKSSFTEVLSSITSIDLDTLTDLTFLPRTSVAKRMSWAAKRHTTRPEDVAYSLIGIFDINMPLLYGEGEKAFIRLQEEILKESDDQSLLAWEDPDQETGRSDRCSLGILARNPATFCAAGDIETIPYHGDPMRMTSKGLQGNLPVMRAHDDMFFLILSCTKALQRGENESMSQLAILIDHSPHDDGTFGRVPGLPLEEIPDRTVGLAKAHDVLLSKRDIVQGNYQSRSFEIEFSNEKNLGYRLKEVVYAAKPFTTLTIYKSIGSLVDDSESHSVQSADFPPGRADYIVAFDISHSTESHRFVVLLESRRARLLWYTTIFWCSKDFPLKRIMEDTAGSFQNDSHTLPLQHGVKITSKISEPNDRFPRIQIIVE
jgi:hypothetical protein